jgi:hypothetical protein
MAVSIATLGVIEQKEDGKGDHGVDSGPNELMSPMNVEVGHAQKAAVN